MECKVLNADVTNKIILPPSHFFCPLFHFEMSQNIVMFLKIKVINLLMFLWGQRIWAPRPISNINPKGPAKEENV